MAARRWFSAWSVRGVVKRIGSRLSAVAVAAGSVCVAAWLVAGLELPDGPGDRVVAVGVISVAMTVLAVPMLLAVAGFMLLVGILWAWCGNRWLDAPDSLDKGTFPVGFGLIMVLWSAFQVAMVAALVPLCLWASVRVCDAYGPHVVLATPWPAVAAGLVYGCVSTGVGPTVRLSARRASHRAAAWNLARYVVPLAAFACALVVLGPVHTDESASAVQQTAAVLGFAGIYLLLSRAMDADASLFLFVVLTFRISPWSYARLVPLQQLIALIGTFGVLWLATIPAGEFEPSVHIDTWWALMVTAAVMWLAEWPLRLKAYREKAAKDAVAAEKDSWNVHMPGPMDFRSPPFN